MGITSDNTTLNKHLSILVEAITSQIIVVVLENGYVYNTITIFSKYSYISTISENISLKLIIKFCLWGIKIL